MSEPSDLCDRCQQPFENLHVMQHLPAMNIGKFYRPQMLCDSCAGVQPGQTPPCPPAFLREDGSCKVCQTARR